mmetsp:Transcript_4770/g.9796  ORF Transcript_4770/g.9796 Transcript_4770/m.9796 type:complete len:176 (-) Transcript_4770:105-632(-)
MLRTKLISYGLPDLSFPVYSDPSWSLMMLEPKDRIYVENRSHPFLLKAGAFDEAYRMVQPALVVLDSTGKVVYWWSWNKLKAGTITEDGVLPNGRHEDNPDGNTHDVRWRPVPEDLLLKLSQGSDLEDLRVENIGFPNKKDHASVKKSLYADPAQHRRNQQKAGMETDIISKGKL